ncbi:sulfotransferase family protein [Candidatus Rhodobacter oscarellae]|uniref:sulfotransferase family protein n=1 Tax=Candidatus Rhodobacter oscarellae TaxID=1675527 RepID=UPI0009E2ACBE|nr:sulfotransferase family protein [Candidatus Rhodobacter lobularis]
MTLAVIGTGFGRTGTESMRFALEMLGFDPCHHMRQVYRDDTQMRLWADVAVRGQAPDWERLFEGFQAAVDWPSVLYWRDLIDAFPDARVILTHRSPESWWLSYEKTLLKVVKHLPGTDLARGLMDLTFDKRPLDRDHCISVYKAHVREVLDTVPKERLLIHNLGDGWKPLCKHLGVAIPDAPYPSSNAGASFKPAHRPEPD